MNLVPPLRQFQQRVNQHPDKPFLHQPLGNGDWKTYTWQDVDREARTIAAGLHAQGLAPGDRVAIFAQNCAEWAIADMAIAMAGMISVPIYSSAGATTVNYVLAHSESKVLFVGEYSDETALSHLNNTVITVGFNQPYSDGSWQEWLDKYSPLQSTPEPTLDDTYTIVYTSGSTGQPKGVVLSNRNITAAAVDTAILYPGNGHRVLSYLPLAHITERSVVWLTSLFIDGEIFFNESLATFIDDLKHTRPTFFISVPRLWAKFQANIIAKIPDTRLQFLLNIPLISQLVAAIIRRRLGFTHCRLYLSGSAPISPSLLRWYGKLGVDISEGWGMSETAGAACANVPFVESQLGSIGVPFKQVELKTADNDELLIRGPCVFTQYYKSPDKTAESFVDGWFRTGDRATQTAEGAWRIIGRTKDQFKTSKGKYVTPTPIENLLGASAIIEQCCVVGNDLSQPVALVILADIDTSNQKAIEQELRTTLIQTNETLESHQKLDRLIILKEAFSPQNGLLTPTLKLKRSDIEQRYDALVRKPMTGDIVWEKELV